MTKFMFFLAFILVLKWQIMAQPVDTEKITAEFIRKGEENSNFVKSNYVHEEVEIEEKFDKGVLKEKKERKYLVEESDGVLRKTLISINGLEVVGAQPEPKKEIIAINEKFLSRYNYSFERYETLGKEKCIVLSFHPKNNLDEEEDKFRVLNVLVGQLWLSEKNKIFKKLVARIPREVNYALPSFTGLRVQRLEAVAEAIEVNGRFFLKTVIVVYDLKIKVFFFQKELHSKVTIRYENYTERGRQ